MSSSMMPPIPGASNELMSFLASMLTRLDNTEKLAVQVKALEAENNRLQAELADTRKRLEQATTSQTSLPLGNSPNVSTSDPAPNPSSQEPGLEASTWAAKASVNRPPPARKGPSPRRVAASQRIFTAASGPLGYKYVYIPRSRRLTHREVRSSLRTLGIDTARLLDINFPARGVVGILVHLQFVDEFEAQLNRAKVEIIGDFDPVDPQHLADPKYHDLPLDERANTAIQVQNARCLQTLKFLRPHVALPVAHFFVEEGWISSDEVPPRSALGGDAEQLMSELSIGLWNANGLQPRAINDVLNHCQSLHMLFITETWLLSPARILTSWSQFHLYGPPVAGTYRGSMGVSLLVSPSCPYTVTQIPMPNNYALAVKIGTLRLVCVYLPPSMSTADALSVLSDIPLTEDTLLCGDFNARLGSITGDYATNSRGLALSAWLEERSLTVLNGSLSPCTPTYISFRREVEISSIIDLFITNTNFANPSLHIQTELSLGSDHRLLSLSFTYDLDPSPPSPPPLRRLWNLSRLKEPDVLQLYTDSLILNATPLLNTLQDIVQNPPSSPPPIDALTNDFNTLIYDSLSSSIGTRPHRPSKWKKFWTPALQAAADHRDGCYKQWRRACGIDKINWWSRHQHAHQEFRQQVQTAKRQSWHAFCRSLERDFAKATSKIKQIKRRRQPKHVFQHDDGPAAAATIMCNHLASVYSGHILPSSRPPPPPSTSPHLPFAAVDSPFDSSVVEEYMRFMPSRKAPGPDHIRAEMLKPHKVDFAPDVEHWTRPSACMTLSKPTTAATTATL
ncbi:hypothetical protein CLU79DRAFT_806011 [Phycomyces nitens]|nr:hypothetical protein CLU79DRAFT_806011 [Phycomyces nitens]